MQSVDKYGKSKREKNEDAVWSVNDVTAGDPTKSHRCVFLAKETKSIVFLALQCSCAVQCLITNVTSDDSVLGCGFIRY